MRTHGDRLEIDRALTRLGPSSEVLRRHGIKTRGAMCFCPFHPNEHTPAMSLFQGNDGRSRWKCHACDEHGDAIDLEARLSGRTIGDVIKDWSR